MTGDREARALILLARPLGVPTICVQESVINFTDTMRRMRHAEHVLVQGAVSARMLADRRNISITGNPRYEKLAIGPQDQSANVLLNCNFTYGVEEDNRYAWLKAAVDACDATGSPVTILQHPRDTADLSVYGKPVIRTNAGTIHDRLRGGLGGGLQIQLADPRSDRARPPGRVLRPAPGSLRLRLRADLRGAAARHVARRARGRVDIAAPRASFAHRIRNLPARTHPPTADVAFAGLRAGHRLYLQWRRSHGRHSGPL